MDPFRLLLITSNQVEGETQIAYTLVNLLERCELPIKSLLHASMLPDDTNGTDCLVALNRARDILHADSSQHTTRGKTVELRRPLQVERFGGTLLVALRAKPIESMLLLLHRTRRRAGCVLLQRTMHPIVDLILFRMVWLDEFGADTELDVPQHSRESNGRNGTVRETVVGSDL